MAERMEVDTEHLRAGADRCSDAAGMAMVAAAKLAEKKPAVGITESVSRSSIITA